MVKFLLILCTAIALFIGGTNIVLAAKPLPKKSAGTPRPVSFPVSVKYRGDKQGILLTFNNFRGIESASYSFTYNTNGVAQGAGGTITANNNPTAQRELLFGTCSTSVCRYHFNLSGARLTLTIKYTNGRIASKVYRIKTYQ